MTAPCPRRALPRPARALLAAALVASLPACDYLGIQSGAAQAAAREAEGKAVGGACRHAGRAIEDCYAFNPNAPKAAVFAGWKAMNDYMAENKLDVVKPQIEPKMAGPRRKDKDAAAAAAPGDAARAGKPAG